MDVSGIKNNSSKQQIRSKMPTVCGPGLQHGTSTLVYVCYSFYSFFFLTAVCQARIYSLCLFKKSDGLYFFPANLITFNSNWSVNSPINTAVDIVLDFSENSHGKVYCEVFSKIVAYEHGVC